jgi:hypothetical protein
MEKRVLKSEIFVAHNNTGIHAHHNKKLLRFLDVMSELERVSLKYKIKKIIRRIFKNG